MKTRWIVTVGIILGMVLGFRGLLYSTVTREPVDLTRAPKVTKAQAPYPYNKIHPYLYDVVRTLQKPQADLRSLRASGRQHGFRWIRQTIHLRLIPNPGQTQSILDALEQIGIFPHTVNSQEIEVLAPPQRLEDIARIPSVRQVTHPRWYRPLYSSQGLQVIGAHTWMQLPQVAGQDNVSIGIVDIGFDKYDEIIGEELPRQENIITRNFRADDDFKATEHGTAVAEIISDFVPNAKIYLTAISTAGELAEAIDWLRSQNVIAISGSIGSSWRAGDGTGSPEYDTIDAAANANIAPIFAAGNEGMEHWQRSNFYNPDGDRWLNFAENDELNCFPAEEGLEITLLLEWYDWPASARDYDLYLYRWPSMSLVGSSEGLQNGLQEPVEYIDIIAPATGTYCAAIRHFSGPTDVPLEMFVTSPSCGGYTACFDYSVPSGSIGAPADGRNAIAVGAVVWDTLDLAPYSSRGPTHDGRLKPDISAPTHVDTYAYGTQGFLFTGTSAATPHVTGAIALMRHKLLVQSSGFSIYQAILARVKDFGSPGPDQSYGRGFLYMLAQ